MDEIADRTAEQVAGHALPAWRVVATRNVLRAEGLIGGRHLTRFETLTSDGVRSLVETCRAAQAGVLADVAGLPKRLDGPEGADPRNA